MTYHRRSIMFTVVAMLAVFSLAAASCSDDQGAADGQETTDSEASDSTATDEPDAPADSTDTGEAAADGQETTDSEASDSTATDEPDAPADSTDTGEAAATGEADGEEPCIRVAVLVNLDRNDAGWNQAHAEGADFVAEQLPCAEVLLLENQHEEPATEAVMRDLAADGYDLIFGTSFGHMEFMARAAEDNPDVVFEHASGFMSGPNFSNYIGALYQAAYLAGMAAGAASESGKIGYVGPFATPDVLRDLNGFVLGAREINPDIEVQMIWVNSWFDPALETQAAETLLDDGADVLFYGTASAAVGQTADRAGASWVGSSGLARGFAPDSFLAAPNYNWGVYMLKATQAVIDGEWVSESYFGSMADGFISLSELGPNVSADTAALIEQRAEEFRAGTFEPFTGPILNQAGDVIVAEGDVISFGQLFSIDWVIEGVDGTVPS